MCGRLCECVCVCVYFQGKVLLAEMLLTKNTILQEHSVMGNNFHQWPWSAASTADVRTCMFA